MPKDKSKDKKTDKEKDEVQNIPEEVLKQLPPEVKAELGYAEEQKPIFQAPIGENTGLSGSIDRLREGFEKIGLTLIGRMGEFASTLERVVITVARIEKVEQTMAEATYFLKNLQKTLEDFKRDFNKVVDKMDNVEIGMERTRTELAMLKGNISSGISVQTMTPVEPKLVTKPTALAHSQLKLEKESQYPAKTSSFSQATTAQPPISAIPTSKPAGNQIDAIFINLQAQMKVGANANSVADLLDKAREIISKFSKWTPAVYEIGKLARKIRKTSAALTEAEISEIITILNQWKNQIIQI